MSIYLEMIAEARQTIAETGYWMAVAVATFDGDEWRLQLSEVRCPNSTKTTDRLNWKCNGKVVSGAVAKATLG